VAYALDPPRFLAARGRRFGVFANPPTMADVRDVAFDGSEYRDLRRCRPGDCVAKLPASEMSTFIGRIDWSASDAKARADQQLRDLLLRLVSEYAAGGNEAMVVYDDAAHAVRAGDVFAELLAQSTNLYASAPALERYLTTYPASRPPGARDYLYWAEDRLPRLRPTLTLGHVVVYAPPEAESTAAFVARKQLYASHYFEGALELLAVVDAAGSGAQPAAYLITVRRFRFDALPGGLLNIRGRVRSQMVDAMRADLEHHRSALAATHSR